MNNFTALLETIEINPATKPIATVVWMHGLGADGNDFVPLVPELKLPQNMPVRFVFPNAPMQPVTLNYGYVMRSWYDIITLEANKHADEKGIAESVAHINRIIEREEANGIPTDKIILAGFSQGAVMALSTGLIHPKRLGGIIALSGYLPFEDNVMAKASVANKTIPIFLAHGKTDMVVPYFLGEMARDVLHTHHYPVEWNSYPIPHSVCVEEIQDISMWMQKIIKAFCVTI